MLTSISWRVCLVLAGIFILAGGPRHPRGTMAEMLAAISPARAIAASTAFALSVAPDHAAAQQWTPPVPKNLEVLPAGTEGRAVVMTMRGFTMGLGVRCQHCHVYKGADPDDLSSFDFAADDKPEKEIARTMIRMTRAINGEHLKDVGEPRADGEAKVTCYTCHRGQRRPLTRRPGGTPGPRSYD